MKRTVIGKIALVCALALGLSGAAGAATVVKMSHIGPANVENNVVHYFVKEFASRVTERTQGNITFELYPDEQLGSEEQRMELMM